MLFEGESDEGVSGSPWLSGCRFDSHGIGREIWRVADSYYILAGKTREYIFHERASRQMATRKFAESRPFSSGVFCSWHVE